ncbi:MAG: hypothetical protein ACQEUT_07960 [Bacillota bacterium]
MKQKLSIKWMFRFSLVMTSLLFLQETNCCLTIPKTAASSPNFAISQPFILTSPDVHISEEGRQERPLFENILLYLIIFIPVVIVTMIVWIFSKVLKLAQKKNEA